MNKKKTRVRVKNKPNWKFYTLIISIVGLVAVLILALCHHRLGSWIISILFPVVLSAAVSMGVSLWFTIKSERDRLADELIREIDGLHSHIIRLTSEISEIVQNPFYSVLLKKQMLNGRFLVMPDMYRIKVHYRVLYDLYKTNRGKMINEIQSWDEKLDYNGLIDHFKHHGPNLFMLTMEITDTALKVQEQYHQDFRGEPKAPIPDQLIFRVGKDKSSDMR